MTVGLALTVIFLVLKYVFHAIDWPLWACFIPMMIEAGLVLLIWLVFGLLAALGMREPKRKRGTFR